MPRREPPGKIGIAWRLTFKGDMILRKLDRLKKRVPLVAARTTVDARRSFKTEVTRAFLPKSNIIRGREGTPRQTIAGRIDLSYSGTATRTYRKGQLESVTIVRFEVMPFRHFARTPNREPVIPAGARIEQGYTRYVNLGPVVYPIANAENAKAQKGLKKRFEDKFRSEIAQIF